MEDLRLFRMRLDRDAINNDALTDPMAGGRPHESHDLTFAWVARARSRPENRSRCDFSAAPRRRRSNRAISSVTPPSNTRNASRILAFSLFLHPPFSPFFFTRNRLFTFDRAYRSLRRSPRSPPANLPIVEECYALFLLSILVCASIFEKNGQ